MIRRPSSFWHSMLPKYFEINMLLLAAVVFAAPAHADPRLQLSRDMASRHDKGIAAPVARDNSDIDVHLRLEYELTAHVDRMTGTTRELRTIIEAMPGPSLPPGETTPPPPVHYASPLEETLARLNHVELLVADITRIIEAMPFVGRPMPVVEYTNATALPRPAIPRPAPAPKPIPAPAPDTPTLTPTARAVELIIGGLAASVLAIYLRRWFMRTRPSRKELAATIKPPPLKDETLELADVMTSMGLGAGAARALAEHVHANPRQALSHWLKLLDVYRQTGNQAEFETTAAEMHTAFNIKPESWDDKEGNGGRYASLENYPHIAAQLKKLWPTPECSEYLLSLLADNREGKRAGFPLAVVEEIILLLAVLQAENQ